MLKAKKVIITFVISIFLVAALCLPVSALSINEYGFSITSVKLGWGTTPAQCITNSKYALEPTHYSNEQVEFRNITGNAAATSYYRPLVLTVKGGTTNSSYTVNVQYISYYGQNGVSGAFNLDGSPFAYVGGAQPSDFRTYSRYDQSGNLFYGGQFSFTINKGVTKTLYLCSGYNESVANLQGFSVWFDITPNSETSQILQDNQQNTDAIINNQNSNTQTQIDADKENTDAIINNQNSNTQTQIDADKENTDAIINNQNELAEQEKDNIQNSGDTATESVDDVPNESEGFINALGDLVGALSYDGTECKWTFPQVKIPQIGNIVPEMVLIEEQDIDFGQWVDKMPRKVLLLVRNVCTCALIVYCFKELYSTISYVLTLKGGGE